MANIPDGKACTVRAQAAIPLVQDCVDLLCGKGFYAPYGPKVSVDNSASACYYIRGGNFPADEIAQHWGNAIITKPVSVASVHAWLKENPGAFIAALSAEC